MYKTTCWKLPAQHFLLNLILHSVSIKHISVSEIKWQTAPVLSASTQPKQDTKKITSQTQRELHPSLKNPSKEPFFIKYLFNCLKASRERGSLKILLPDGARACRPIGLDRRRQGLVREEWQTVSHANIFKKISRESQKSAPRTYHRLLRCQVVFTKICP